MTERGMALVAALLALLVLGALVAGAFHVGHLEQRTGRGSFYAAEALDAAEAGLAVVVGQWGDFPQLGALDVEESLALPSTHLGTRSSFQPTVVRLTPSLYLVRSQGVRADAEGNVLAQRLVAALVRTDDVTVVPLLQRRWAQLY